MSAAIRYDESRDAYVIEGAVESDRFRLIVPQDFLDDELRDDATADERHDWIEANLPHILTAYTARTDGGWVKAPWNRVLVEEVD